MVELEFNLNDVTKLAQKLNSVQGTLTGQERQLLLAIFAAAAASAKVVNAATNTSTLPKAEIVAQGAGGGGAGVTLGDLQRQLLNAYIPGNYFEAVDGITNKTVGLQTFSAQVETPAAGEGGQPKT